jgi:hypothetical protein
MTCLNPIFTHFLLFFVFFVFEYFLPFCHLFFFSYIFCHSIFLVSPSFLVSYFAVQYMYYTHRKVRLLKQQISITVYCLPTNESNPFSVSSVFYISIYTVYVYMLPIQRKTEARAIFLNGPFTVG